MKPINNWANRMPSPLDRRFAPEPESAGEVRRFVKEALDGAARLDDIVLVASEVASNVIRHARTEFSVRVTSDDALVRMEVSDGSSIVPAVEDLADHKRGLRIVESVSDRWGFQSGPTGKTVWAESIPFLNRCDERRLTAPLRR